VGTKTPPKGIQKENSFIRIVSYGGGGGVEKVPFHQKDKPLAFLLQGGAPVVFLRRETFCKGGNSFSPYSGEIAFFTSGIVLVSLLYERSQKKKETCLVSLDGGRAGENPVLGLRAPTRNVSPPLLPHTKELLPPFSALRKRFSPSSPSRLPHKRG